MQTTTDKFVNADTVGDVLGLKAKTVLGMARENRIPSIRISERCVRFDLNEVIDSLKGGNENADTR